MSKKGCARRFNVGAFRSDSDRLAIICIVNGPGEMASRTTATSASGRQDRPLPRPRGREGERPQGVAELVALIQADGKWVDPQDGNGQRAVGSGQRQASNGLGRGRSTEIIPLSAIERP
jgi:hypothetical protein